MSATLIVAIGQFEKRGICVWRDWLSKKYSVELETTVKILVGKDMVAANIVKFWQNVH